MRLAAVALIALSACGPAWSTTLLSEFPANMGRNSEGALILYYCNHIGDDILVGNASFLELLSNPIPLHGGKELGTLKLQWPNPRPRVFFVNLLASADFV